MSVYTVREGRKNRATDVDRTVEMDAITSPDDESRGTRIPNWDEVIHPAQGIGKNSLGPVQVAEGGPIAPVTEDNTYGPEFHEMLSQHGMRVVPPLSIDEANGTLQEDLSSLDEDGNPLRTPPAPTKRVARHATPKKRPPLRFKNLPKDDPKTKGNSSGSRSHLAGWGRMKNLFGYRSDPARPVQPHLDPNLDPVVRQAFARQYAEHQTDLMAAGVMLLGVLFVFVGAWVVFGFGVGLLSAGGIFLFLGFWTSMDNHKRASVPPVTQVRAGP